METASKGLMGRVIARQTGSTGRVLWTLGLVLAAALGVMHAKLEARDHASRTAPPWTTYEVSSDESVQPCVSLAVYEGSERWTTPRPASSVAMPVRRVVLVYKGSEANAWRTVQGVRVDALRGARVGLSL